MGQGAPRGALMGLEEQPVGQEPHLGITYGAERPLWGGSCGARGALMGQNSPFMGQAAPSRRYLWGREATGALMGQDPHIGGTYGAGGSFGMKRGTYGAPLSPHVTP